MSKPLDPELVQYSRRVAAELQALRKTLSDLTLRVAALEQRRKKTTTAHRDAKGFITHTTEEWE